VTVVDASVVADWLLGIAQPATVRRHLTHDRKCAPEILVPEVLSAVRRAERRGKVSPHRVEGAVDDLLALELELIPHSALARRAFELRANVTCGDALYVALAEALGEPLLTADAGLARAVRRHTNVEVVATRPERR